MKEPRVEFLCVGTELLSGRLNTHAAYMAGALASIGLKLAREASLSDAKEEIGREVAEAVRRADIILISGGLGPTFDDLTREGVAEAVKKRIILDEPILDRLKSRFKRLGRRMPPSNKRQAQVLEGARIVENRVGSAPGQILLLKRGGRKVSVVLLPGPPQELKPMLEGEVLPYLKETHAPGLARRSLVLKLAGVTESEADERLRPLIRRYGSRVEFTILASMALVEIHASASGRDEAKLEADLGRARSELLERLGEFIYAEGPVTLETAVLRRLKGLGKSLAAAERGTAGALSQRLGGAGEGREAFLGGILAESDGFLGPELGAAQGPDPLSEERTRAAARSLARLSGADFVVALAAGVEPPRGLRAAPRGRACIAVAGPGFVHSESQPLHGDRAQVQSFAATMALIALHRSLKTYA